MLRPRHLITSTLLIFLLSMAVPFAQDKEKIKYLTPTHKGSTGLFNLFVADTLRQGEFSIGLNAHKFNRDPGDIDFTIFPVSFTIGLHDRIELFGSYEVYKRVHADSIAVNKVAPGGPIVPARLSNRSRTLAYYNDAPFMDVGFGDGSGDLWAGIKFNLFSERRGDALGLAVQPIARFHMTDDRSHLLRGLTAGVTDAGFDVILSKNFGGGGTFTGNAGFLFADDKFDVDRQPRFNWGLGFDAPLGGLSTHLIGELLGSTFYGSRRTSTFVNVRSPVDAYLGLRVHPSKWIAISGAANYHLNHLDRDLYNIPETDHVGFFAQVALQRKINEPPTIECTTSATTVTEGDRVTITARAFDPDDDDLTITWRTSGGRLEQQGDSATLDTTGLTPGRYTVTAEVTDGEHVASCSTDVTVEKRKIAPTISCEPSTVSVTEGESVTLRAQASDANNDPLTYAWTIDGQSVTNNSPEFVFGTSGRSVGSHTVRVTVTDVDGMSASCEFTVTIERRPNQNPDVTLTLDKTQVFAGETVNATAQATDPDNDPLTYAWTVDGQSRSETGTTLAINTSGMAGGSHSVTVTVNDGRGGTDSDTKSFTVVEKIVIQIDRIEPDNQAKARLDEIALRMQQNPQLHARITGHTDNVGSDEANVRVGQRRADAVKNYLVRQHNIDSNRIQTTSAGESQPIADNSTAAGRKENRRVEIELYVP